MHFVPLSERDARKKPRQGIWHARTAGLTRPQRRSFGMTMSKMDSTIITPTARPSRNASTFSGTAAPCLDGGSRQNTTDPPTPVARPDSRLHPRARSTWPVVAAPCPGVLIRGRACMARPTRTNATTHMHPPDPRRPMATAGRLGPLTAPPCWHCHSSGRLHPVSSS